MEMDNVGLFYGVYMVLNMWFLEEGKMYGGSGMKVIFYQQDELLLKRVGFYVFLGYVIFVDMKK